MSDDLNAHMAARIAAGRGRHGVGDDDYLPGNVQHLVSPIVGILRRRERDGEAVDLPWVIDRLGLVLDLAREADDGRLRHAREADTETSEDKRARLLREDPQASCSACGHWLGGHDAQGCRTLSCRCVPARSDDGRTAVEVVAEPVHACRATAAGVVGLCGRDAGHPGDHRSVGPTFTVWWDR